MQHFAEFVRIGYVETASPTKSQFEVASAGLVCGFSGTIGFFPLSFDKVSTES